MADAPRIPTFDELYAEIEALPEGRHGEILGPGWMRPVGRPGAWPSRAAMRILRRLEPSSIDEGGDWWLGRELEVRLPGDKLYVPTLVGWRVDGGPLDFLDENPVRRVPAWACEILSRDIQKPDRAIKLPTYAAVGVAHTWAFDVEALCIEVWATRDGLPSLVATVIGDEELPLPPFDLPFSPAKLLARRM